MLRQTQAALSFILTDAFTITITDLHTRKRACYTVCNGNDMLLLENDGCHLSYFTEVSHTHSQLRGAKEMHSCHEPRRSQTRLFGINDYH